MIIGMIGLGGAAGVGKSSVARILCEQHGYKEYSFAKNLKEMCKEVFYLTDEMVYTQSGKKELLPQTVKLDQVHMRAIDRWIRDVNKWRTRGNEVLAMMDKCLGKEFNTPREILQYVGTEICREVYDNNFHIKVVDRQIEDDGHDKAVISDARFANERAYVRENGGVRILIESDKQEDLGEHSKHASETSMGTRDDYDYVLFNPKKEGFDHLELLVKSLLMDIR